MGAWVVMGQVQHGFEGSSHPLAVESLPLLGKVLPVSVFQQSRFYCGVQESLELSSS